MTLSPFSFSHLDSSSTAPHVACLAVPRSAFFRVNVLWFRIQSGTPIPAKCLLFISENR
jgi:hypothetical protein